FFQAEDGIRDFHVTGVQTCALPICSSNNGPSTSKTIHACPMLPASTNNFPNDTAPVQRPLQPKSLLLNPPALHPPVPPHPRRHLPFQRKTSKSPPSRTPVLPPPLPNPMRNPSTSKKSYPSLWMSWPKHRSLPQTSRIH